MAGSWRELGTLTGCHDPADPALHLMHVNERQRLPDAGSCRNGPVIRCWGQSAHNHLHLKKACCLTDSPQWQARRHATPAATTAAYGCLFTGHLNSHGLLFWQSLCLCLSYCLSLSLFLTVSFCLPPHSTLSRSESWFVWKGWIAASWQASHSEKLTVEPMQTFFLLLFAFSAPTLFVISPPSLSPTPVPLCLLSYCLPLSSVERPSSLF